MNFNSAVRHRVAIISAFSAAVIATGYAASEHDRAQTLDCRARGLETSAVEAVSTPASPARYAEITAEDNPLPKIRQAARDFIQEKKPGAKVEGVFTLSFGRDSGLYIAGVDTTLDGQRRTIDLLVRLYTRKNGGTYWRAESIGQGRAAALMDKTGIDQ